MSSTPHTNKATPAPGEPAKAASTQDTPGSVKPAQPVDVDPAADDAMARLTALQLDAHAQTLRAVSAPTEVNAAAADEVSALTAARFGAHAAMLQRVSAQFAAAHEALMKSLTNSANSDVVADPGGANPAT